MKTNLRITSILSFAVLLALAGCENGGGRGTSVQAPGVDVRVDPGGGTSVRVPGVDVNAGPGGADVRAPGVDVQTR